MIRITQLEKLEYPDEYIRAWNHGRLFSDHIHAEEF